MPIRQNKFSYALLLLSILPVLLSAQSVKYYSKNNGAIRAFEEGRKYYDSRQDDKAIRAFENAIAKDSLFIDAWMILGNIFIESNMIEEAIRCYRKAVSIDPAYFPSNNSVIGQLELRRGNYQKAKEDLTRYVELSPKLSEAQKQEQQRYIGNCDFALEALRKPVPFEPANMGKGVNSREAEYYPSLTVDQKEFVFTRDVPDANSMEGHQEDFFISALKDSTWQAARNTGAPLNSALNEGAPSISADGRLLFFTACERPDGKGSCDIYLSQRMPDGSWSKPLNIGSPINTAAWESQPSFSSDGKTLYFIRGITNAQRVRQQDIYTSTFQADMTWSEPRKLSDVINTPQIEESVFIHPDNQTLYFSSDGHTGMGGLDIFLSRRGDDGIWTKPVNLGYPINTYDDENSLVVSADGKMAYFASDRKGGFGKLDLYQFSLYPEARPSLVNFVRARVRDAVSNAPLAADFEIIDVATGKVLLANTTDKKKGEFLACLPAGKNYMLNVNKLGYLFYSDYFECPKGTDRQNAYELDIRLQAPKSGEKVVLKNIFFDVNKYDLKQESFAELGKLLAFLKSQSSLRIEISGHTDATGDKKANQVLSQNRAKAVYDYLIAQGIPEARLAYKGYGDSAPVAGNDSEEGRARNRRTEFRIL
jgi:outer membrane protein OmpA-like peptidoglycan-associated protein/tetratricopeptide (TPR) repeat protein